MSPTTPAAIPTSAPLVIATIANNVGTITLNNSTRRNALSEVLLDQVISALDDFKAKEVRVVILRAFEGATVWSAGHDIKELPQTNEDPLGYSDPLERTLRAIRAFPAPVIAMIHGSVWGGAFDLVASCDIVIADETCSFAITPANLGLPYNTTGLMHFLGRLPVNLVKELFFTAAPIKGDDAYKWGVVNHLVPSAELEEFTNTFAVKITQKAPLAIAVAKEQLRILTDYQPVAAQIVEQIQDMRRRVYESKDYIEGIEAFLQKRPAVFTGK
jgi:methylmalonyl-CoA decarboxylase